MNHQGMLRAVMALLVGVIGGGFMESRVMAKAGEIRGAGHSNQGSRVDQGQRPAGKVAPRNLALNKQFKTERTTLRNDFKSARKVLLDKMKAGTITKEEYVAQKKALLDQFKTDREAMRSIYKLEKQALKAELGRDADEDKEDLKDQEKNEKPNTFPKDATRGQEKSPKP